MKLTNLGYNFGMTHTPRLTVLVPCASPACQRNLGPLEAILATAVGGHCVDDALALGLFMETEVA